MKNIGNLLVNTNLMLLFRAKALFLFSVFIPGLKSFFCLVSLSPD